MCSLFGIPFGEDSCRIETSQTDLEFYVLNIVNNFKKFIFYFILFFFFSFYFTIYCMSQWIGEETLTF